jgi:hypothetical protein
LPDLSFANGTIKTDYLLGTNPDASFIGGSVEKWEFLAGPTTKITIDRKDAQLAGLQAIKSDSNPEVVIVECDFEVLDESKDHKPSKGRAICLKARGEQVNGVIQNVNVAKYSMTTKLVPIYLDPVFREGFDIAKDVERVQLDVAKDVEVIINGKPAKFTDLRPNMKVFLQKAAGKSVVLAITAFGTKVTGVIKAVDAQNNSLSVRILFCLSRIWKNPRYGLV